MGVVFAIVKEDDEMRVHHAATNRTVEQEKLHQQTISLIPAKMKDIRPSSAVVVSAAERVIEDAARRLSQVTSVDVLPAARILAD